jgi:hypothetical protein
MKICGTNLVPIFITMVFCGIIFIYFNSRLAEVKSSVEKQNRVLTAFITNVQSDIKNGGMILGQNVFAGSATAGAGTGATGTSASAAGTGLASANHLASEEALRAVRRNEKIVVSDDEDDDDSDSEDDDEDDDDDSDSEDDEDEEEDVPVIEISSISIQELPPTSIQELPPTSIQELPPTSIQELPSIQESVSLDLIQDKSVQDNLTLDFASIEDYSLKVIDLDSSTAKTDIHYDQMKVDDLRKIVTDLNLIVKDEAKKLKKPELLALLKNKTA